MKSIRHIQAPSSPWTGIAAAASSSLNRSESFGHAHENRSRCFLVPTHRAIRAEKRARISAWFHLGSLLVLCLALCVLLAGCGGGYPGLGFSSLSASQAVIDAGQSVTITATGAGNAPVAWSVSSPSCTGSSCGTLTSMSGGGGMYTAPANVSAPMQVTIVATLPGTTDTHTTTITVNPDPALSGVLPSGTVGVTYTATLHGSGGTGALTLAVASGSLPSGLTFNAGTGVISGTPTAPGTTSFVAQVSDSAPTPVTVKAAESITIATATAPLTLLGGNPPSGTVGTPYSTALIAAGGSAPYTFSLLSGTLPAGLTLSPAGLIAGTPTAAGTSTFTAQVQDGTGVKATASFSITVTTGSSSLSITVGSLPSGTVGVPYTSTIGVAGGSSPYTCTVTSGALPSGLSLGAGCVVSGTPTAAGTANLTVKATDSSNPVLTTTGPVSLTISPAGLSLTTGSLPAGTVGTPYSSTIGVAGGTSPYSCTITSGTLQAGLTLGANCLVSGTPTAPGTVNLTVKATDSGNPAQTITGPVTLTINPVPLAISTGTLPNGTVGTPYSSTIGVSGGTAPYSCTVTSGTLQAGLTLGANCLVSGTPTVSGTVNLTVKATDSSNPTLTATGPVSLTINAAPMLTLTGPAAGTVGTPYTGTIAVSGGTGPYTCTLNSGTLEAGLTFNNNCTVTGTPTASGTNTLNVSATDASKPANTTTGNVAVTINPAAVTLAVGNPPPATVGQPYTGTVPVSGGTGPYTCQVASGGALPQGLAFSTGCTITGTPITGGTTMVPITVTDSSNPPVTTTTPITVTVQAPLALTFTGSLPNAILNQPYSQTLAASGGVAPYTYAVTSGALPAGITLNSSTGLVSGTPTAPGASTFTVTATDSESPAQTAPLPLTLLVVYAPTPTDALLQGPYAFLFQGYDNAIAGVLAYRNATIGSFTADGNGVLTTGELDTNHQGTAVTGSTVPTNALMGTYTLGMDDRGTLTISFFNADGTVADTTTYAIAVKAPISPATTTARGSMVESNDGLIAGSTSSGTFLQQTATAFATGLTGSYAFGLQGDAPCVPACTANLLPSIVVTVGEMATANNIITGEADTNIAATNYPTAALSGTNGASDTNGRVQLSLTNPSIANGQYPSDFALYIVNATQAFVMSTDKHSAFTLLAGSTTTQAATPFSNASLSGQFVGYENSPTNPGLGGVVINNAANLSTATLFQGSANSTGTCTTNYVEQGGTSAVVNGATGLGNGSAILTYLLGAYAATGNSNCTVGSNGRAVINYPIPPSPSLALQLLGITQTPPAPRVAYLSSTNTGYFLETGYAGFGNLNLQTGEPFSLATLDGTYVYGTTPAVTAATTNASGEFTANGAGQYSYVFDESVLAGNVNAVTIGVTGSGTYMLTDGPNGRFTFGSNVLFAISPTFFVSVDKSATNTSPTVALIQ